MDKSILKERGEGEKERETLIISNLEKKGDTF